MQVTLNPGRIEDYELFLKLKTLPLCVFSGRSATFPDEYAAMIGLDRSSVSPVEADYEPLLGMFDYQRDITALAIRKRKFAALVDCGLGKTLILLDFARHAASQLPKDKCVLIVSPLMVINQTLAEAWKFHGDSLPIEHVRAAQLAEWLVSGKSRIGITNYDGLNSSIPRGRIGALILDESALLKSAYGKWGQECLRLGRGLDWKLALTGTPAPNDRIEYANHAVFLDAEPTVNSFLARYFVNRGQTDNRWELKPHALRPFYRSLSHWAIFLTNPATYGWKDNTEDIPPIHIHIHDVDLTPEQDRLVSHATGRLFATEIGGITSRSVLSQIAKGNHRGQAVTTNKPAYIKALVDSWPDESTIIWCLYNDEQEIMERTFPDAASIKGSTPLERRMELIADFQAGRRKVLISKGKILGFGLNLHIATRMVFSGLQDSYETYYQCVKRANRYGSTMPLNVHIPITEIERPMIETVMAKAARVQSDTQEQEQEFKNVTTF